MELSKSRLKSAYDAASEVFNGTEKKVIDWAEINMQGAIVAAIEAYLTHGGSEEVRESKPYTTGASEDPDVTEVYPREKYEQLDVDKFILEDAAKLSVVDYPEKESPFIFELLMKSAMRTRLIEQEGIIQRFTKKKNDEAIVRDCIWRDMTELQTITETTRKMMKRLNAARIGKRNRLIEELYTLLCNWCPNMSEEFSSELENRIIRAIYDFSIPRKSQSQMILNFFAKRNAKQRAST